MTDQTITPYVKVYDDLQFKRRCVESGYIIDEVFTKVRTSLLELHNQTVRDELIALGWTPPLEEEIV
jgi:hypothetical protein